MSYNQGRGQRGYRGGRGGQERSEDGNFRGGREDYGQSTDDRSQHFGGRGRRGGNFRGDSRGQGFQRGGGSNYRGGGGGNFRGSGGGGGGSERFEKLDRPNMFESVDKQTINQANVVVPGCGELFGSHGQQIALASNYFRVTSLPNYRIHQYCVSFEPDLESVRLRQGILASQKEIIRGAFLFDGSILYLPYKIEDTSLTIQSNRGEDIKITIKHTTSVEPNSPSFNSVVNYIFRRIWKLLDFKQVRRHHFDPKDAKAISQIGLEVWPGISGSLKMIGGQSLYCVDLAHRVVMCESAHDFITREYTVNDCNQIEIEKKLTGERVITRYNNRTYQIDSIDWTRSPKSTFDLKDGRKVSYIDYYKEHYNITIEDPDQPLLVSVLKERRRKHLQKEAAQRGEIPEPEQHIVHLIPELSFRTGLSDDLRNDYNVMRELSQFTRVAPTGRCNGVAGFLQRVEKCPPAAEFLREWGVEFKNQLVSIPARQFPVEKVRLDPTKDPFVPNSKDVDWSQAFRNNQLFNPGSLSNWILFYTARDKEIVVSFLDKLLGCSKSLGFTVSQPRMVSVNTSGVSEYARNIRSANVNDYQLVMCVIPANRKDLYNSIKSLLCVEIPVPSQVVMTKTLNRQNAIMSVCGKIAIQLSVKLGGAPWSVAIPSHNKMLVGIDVSHDTEKTSKNSWMAFVATLNDNFTLYHSRVARQPARTEIADSLNFNMNCALEQYYKLNKKLPDAVIVYRDGVGEGQISVVNTHEVPSIQNCLKEVGDKYGGSIALTYVIVQKRISTRLFEVGEGNATNPIPGAIVDKVITGQEYPNFYLISQSVREGTVNPTHYIIIHNSSRLSTCHLQRLSYKATHLYFNWPGPVRVPAPCQYAHKLSFLISQSIKREPGNSLCNLLYYV